jgi:hypothetical protein
MSRQFVHCRRPTLGCLFLALHAVTLHAQTVAEVPEAIIFATTGQVSVVSKDGAIASGGVAVEPSAETTTNAIVSTAAAGSVVKTGPASSADLALSGGGSVRLDANSELKVSEKKNDKPATESLELLKGRLFLNIDAAELKKREIKEFKLKTPTALLAVKGTRFYAEIGAAYETVGVSQGSVEVTEASAGVKALLKDDSAVAIKAGAISPVRRLTKEQKAWEDNYHQIELVRTEFDMKPDEVSDILEDGYALENMSKTPLNGYLELKKSPVQGFKKRGSIIAIKKFGAPQLKERGILFMPRFDLSGLNGKLIGLEFNFRGDGVIGLAPNVDIYTPEKRREVVQMPSDFPYSIKRRIHLEPGNGQFGPWTSKAYPFFSSLKKGEIDDIRTWFWIYDGGHKDGGPGYLVEGRKEFQVEFSPIVVISRNEKP